MDLPFPQITSTNTRARSRSLTEDRAHERLVVHISVSTPVRTHQFILLKRTHMCEKTQVDLRANGHTLEQLVDLFIRHLLPKLREDVPQLASTNEAVSFLVKHLEASDELLCVSEPVRDSMS